MASCTAQTHFHGLNPRNPSKTRPKAPQSLSFSNTLGSNASHFLRFPRRAPSRRYGMGPLMVSCEKVVESIFGSTPSHSSIFVESKLHPLPVPFLPPPPRFAYLILGSKGDGTSLQRTICALYHPRNQYVVHLDLESLPRERIYLQRFVEGHPTFGRFRNVRMITKANLIIYRGPTIVANTLHAAPILLSEGEGKNGQNDM